MKKIFYLLCCLLTVILVACESNEPGGPSEKPSNQPGNSNLSSAGSFIAKGFSVSDTTTITFSPGNLQYNSTNKKWRFAPNQTDYIGLYNANISSSYNDWIDLFGWGTGNNPTNNSTRYKDYSAFVDWGVNEISSYAPNTWRTLTSDEWEYIIDKRSNADKLKGMAQVNGVNGLILLPDSLSLLPDSLIFPAGVTFTAYYALSTSEWEKLESSGAVFLPAAGRRNGSDVSFVQSGGYYWSATENESYYASRLHLNSAEAYMLYGYRNYGQSVRLVKD